LYIPGKLETPDLKLSETPTLKILEEGLRKLTDLKELNIEPELEITRTPVFGTLNFGH